MATWFNRAVAQLVSYATFGTAVAAAFSELIVYTLSGHHAIMASVRGTSATTGPEEPRHHAGLRGVPTLRVEPVDKTG